MAKCVRMKGVLEVLKVHYQTLYRMENNGLIDVKEQMEDMDYTI